MGTCSGSNAFRFLVLFSFRTVPPEHATKHRNDSSSASGIERTTYIKSVHVFCNLTSLVWMSFITEIHDKLVNSV